MVFQAGKSVCSAIGSGSLKNSRQTSRISKSESRNKTVNSVKKNIGRSPWSPIFSFSDDTETINSIETRCLRRYINKYSSDSRTERPLDRATRSSPAPSPSQEDLDSVSSPIPGPSSGLTQGPSAGSITIAQEERPRRKTRRFSTDAYLSSDVESNSNVESNVESNVDSNVESNVDFDVESMESNVEESNVESKSRSKYDDAFVQTGQASIIMAASAIIDEALVAPAEPRDHTFVYGELSAKDEEMVESIFAERDQYRKFGSGFNIAKIPDIQSLNNGSAPTSAIVATFTQLCREKIQNGIDFVKPSDIIPKMIAHGRDPYTKDERREVALLLYGRGLKLIPFCYNGQWELVVVDFNHKTLEMYSSSGNNRNLVRVRELLKFHCVNTTMAHTNEWETKFQVLPVQQHQNDSAVYVCQWMRVRAQDMDLTLVKSEEIASYRRHMVVDIIRKTQQ